jgi:hypothetical protein
LPFRISLVYHFDPVASWSFDPALLYQDTNISTTIPESIATWTIGVMSIPDLVARGYSIYRGHPSDTVERRRAAVDQFTDRQWKYFSFGPPEYHEYPTPPLPPSSPPTIPDFTCTPSSSSILINFSVADDVEIQSAYAELLDTNYTLLAIKQAEDIPSGAVSYSGVLEFLNLSSSSSYIVKLTAIDTNDNMASREEYITIADVAAPVINQFQVYSPTTGHLKVDVNVTDDSGGDVFCSASLYWIFDLDTELDYYYVELTDGLGSVTFRDLDPERTYIVELFVRDSSYNSRYENREGYPNGAGMT